MYLSIHGKFQRFPVRDSITTLTEIYAKRAYLLSFHDLCGKKTKSIYEVKERTPSWVSSTTDSDCLHNTLQGQISVIAEYRKEKEQR